MSTVESLVVMTLIALGLVGAFEAMGAGYTDVAASAASSIRAAIEGTGAARPLTPATWAPPLGAPDPPRQEVPQGDDAGGFWGWAGDAAKTLGGVAYEMSPLSDLATLFDSNASLLDRGVAALSLMPGPGQAVKWVAKGVKFANRATDSAKATAKVKAGRKAPDADGKNVGAESCTGGACTNGTCFAAGTPVHTEHGLRPIEDIREGDLLWSRDDQTGELSLRRVLHRFITPHRVLLRIVLDTGQGSIEELHVTPPHPFQTRRGWVAAEDLTLEDEVTLLSGEPALVIASETLGEGDTVYNFEVEQFHTYFVGEAGAWVHNAKRPRGKDKCPEAEALEQERKERNPQGVLSQPLGKYLTKNFADAYDEIRAGRGTKRLKKDPATGVERHEVYLGHENDKWAGALEYEVPGEHNARILVMKDEKGNIQKMGWVNPKQAEEASLHGRERNKYEFIQRFGAPHFPDTGWQQRGKKR